MYINILGCVKVKGAASESFRIESGVSQRCVISSWLFNVYNVVATKHVKMGLRRILGRLSEEGRE